MITNRFKTEFAHQIFKSKYANGPNDTWDALAERVVEHVCGSKWGTAQPLMSSDERKELAEHIKHFRFVPGGRYLWYSGRNNQYFNNCYLLRAEEDTREEWAKS